MKPLEGVRVIEFSVAWAGPLCGRYLAELGADVIKVEHPTSRGIGMSGGAMDDSAPWEWGTLPDAQVRTGIFPHAKPGDRWWDRMGHWNKLARGKRSLCLDAKAQGGGEVLRRLIARSDVVLNNYSPRGAASLGLDPASVRAINPRAITVSMSGYGATGPMATHFSWGPILEAHSGFDEATGYAGEGPMRIGLAYPDAAGGVHGAFAVMTALWDRELTGEVNHIDLSQLETLCLMGGPQYLATSVSGQDPERRGNVSLSHAPQGVYRCQGDDAWVAVTVTDDAAWSGLVDLLERAVLRDPALGHVDARFAAKELIDAEIGAWAAGRDRFAAAEALQAVGVAASPAMTNADLVDSGQLADRNFIATWDQPGSGVMSYPGTPLHFASGGAEMLPAPTLGQHNEQILTELGFDATTMAALEADGAIRDSPPY